MRRRNSKTWILAGVLAVVVIGAILAGIFFSGERAVKYAVHAVSEAVDLEVKDFRYAQVGDTDFQWEVRAERAWYRKKDEEVHLERPEVKLISTNGRTYLMTGEQGVLHNESGDMEISGNVVVVFAEGEQVQTETLRYRSLEKQVFTEADVMMKNASMEITGRGMTFALEENELVLLSRVKAVITDASLVRNQ